GVHDLGTSRPSPRLRLHRESLRQLPRPQGAPDHLRRPRPQIRRRDRGASETRAAPAHVMPRCGEGDRDEGCSRQRMSASRGRQAVAATAVSLAALAACAGCGGNGREAAPGPGPGGSATRESLSAPEGLLLDTEGNLYVSELA